MLTDHLSIEIKQNSQSIVNNTSNVTVTVYATYIDGPDDADDPSGYLIIDGTQYDFYNDSGSSKVFTKTVNVPHDSDGTKQLWCEAYYDNAEGSAAKTLTPIPRKSILSASTGYLGQEQTLTITAASDKFTHTITYKCGDTAGTIATKTSATSVTWTPPLSLASLNTANAVLIVTLSLTTYSGSTSIGTDSIDVRYKIGTDALPTFTVEFSDETGYKDIYGYYIQLRSKLNIKVKATAMYGAEITTCKIEANDETFTSNEATTRELSESGIIPVYVYIRDSRGKEAQGWFDVSVEAYSPPTVSSLTIKRCNNDGTENDQGGYVQAKFTAGVDSLDSQNTASYQFAYKKSIDSEYTTVNLTDYENILNISDKTYMFAADTGYSYDVQLTVTDAFGSVTKTTAASTGRTIMHFHSKGNGIGLGKVCEIENSVDVGWNICMNSNRVTNLGTPINNSDATTKNYVDERTHLFAHSQYPDCLYKADGTTVYWLNPPMIEGVEYATMERVDNKTVYCKLIKSTDTIIYQTGRNYVEHGIQNLDRIIRMNSVFCGLSATIQLPWVNPDLSGEESNGYPAFFMVNQSSDYPEELTIMTNRAIFSNETPDEYIQITMYYTKY